MSVSASLALALLSPAAVAAPQTDFDIGYEELVDGDNQAALAAIRDCEELAQDHPARQINLAVALARTGRQNEARTAFEAARSNRERVYLETATGEWVDSKVLARRGLAMLDRGELTPRYALNAN